MDRKSLIMTGIAVLLAAATSAALHENGVAHLKYHFKSETAIRLELERTIEKFNQLYASFFVTGGDTSALNEFPAGNLVKRNIFQDIDLWKKKSQWLIHDMHKTEILRVQIRPSERAVVETRELWDIWLRNTETGMKTGRKSQTIQVRYYLGRDRGRWIVGIYEVFGEDEPLPVISEDLL
jgi:hypothetical protein